MNMDMARLTGETTRQLTTFDKDTKGKTIHVPRGEKVTVGERFGSGYISTLWMTFPGWFYQWWNPSAAVNPSILKTLILHLHWDGETEPAVSAPVCDFFGNGLCESANFANQFFGMSSGGFFCKFPMPFQKGFKIVLENRDPEIDTIVFMNVLYQLSNDLHPDTGYFHAQYRTAKHIKTSALIADLNGRGHFAGCTLSMQGEKKNDLSFLEAPEYMYIDADWEQPRITGTGLEDYFLGGWYFREGRFIGPAHGVVTKEALNSSVAMYRIHERDAVRFSERFRFTFESPWDLDRVNTFSYSSVAFFYLDQPGGSARDSIPSAEDLLCWYRIRDTDHQSIP